MNVGTGKTCTYSGAIGGFGTGASGGTSGASTLTKTGLGTQTLSGTNTYTGATNVNQGTLALVGGSQTSAITVANGASLGFTLGSPTTSTKSVDLTTGTVKITGTVDNSSDYLLMTANLGFTGNLTLVPRCHRLRTRVAGQRQTTLARSCRQRLQHLGRHQRPDRRSG